MKGGMIIPEKTIERLSVYRRLLETQPVKRGGCVYSRQLAEMVSGTAAQVRRDLMAVGVEGHSKRGYCVAELAEAIGGVLDTPEGARIILVGVGDLGRALLGFIKAYHARLRLVAAFDNDPLKIGRVVHGYRCQSVDDLAGVVRSGKVEIAIIATPAAAAQAVCDHLVESGIRGIINFAPVPIQAPPHVWVERADIATALEKVACLVRQRHEDPHPKNVLTEEQ
jgi:redox-sensing transcriptional repressor